MKIHYSFQRLLTGADLAIRRLPVMLADSEQPGPTIWLTACMHGEEVGGIAVVHDIFHRLRKTGLKAGRIHALPMMNPWGFESMARFVHPTDEDLNRSFPGHVKGSLAERMALKIITNILDSKPDLVIDLHNDWVRSVPYGLLDPYHSDQDRSAWEKTKQIMSTCDLLQVQDSESIPQSLTHNLLMRGVPALTLELGESYRINEAQIKVGVEVVWRFLEKMQMVDPSPWSCPPLPPGCRGRLLNYAWGPSASEAGIIRYLVSPGDVVRKGQPIAHIYNSFGKSLKTLKAQDRAVVLGSRDYAMVFPGMEVMAFGLL